MASLIPSGSRIAFKINGKKVALATAVSGEETYSTVPIQVLDQPDVVEHVEVGYDVSFSANKFRVVGSSLKQLGLAPKLSELLIRPELEAEVYDRISGKSLYKIEGVKLTSASWNVNARDTFTETLTFVARKITDESGF